MESNPKCIVCKKRDAIIGRNPPKWCSDECADASSKPSTQPQVKVEPKPEPKPESKVQVEAPKKQKLCIQCQKSAAVHHLPNGSYCDKCKPEEKDKAKICDECKKESDAIVKAGDKVFCDRCWIKVKHIYEEEEKEFDGVLNDPKKINFVHFYPVKKALIKKKVTDDKQEDEEIDYTDFFECFQFAKTGEKADLATAKQWRLSHYSSIFEGALPDVYSSIAKLPEGDIYIITGGVYLSDNSFTSNCNAVIFDRRIGKKDLIESNIHDKNPNLNIRNFRLTELREEKMLNKRAAHTSVVVGDKLYVFGGKNETGYVKDCEALPISKVRKYMIKALVNPKETVFINEKWESIGALSEPRSNAMTFVYSKRVYIFGGYTGPKKLATKVEVFDTVENKWAVLNIKHEFLAASLVLVDEDDAYIIGGSNVSGPSDIVYKWNLKSNEIKKIKELNSSRSDARGTIANVGGQKHLYVFGGRVSLMDYEFISLKDLNSSNGKFEQIEIKKVKLENIVDTRVEPVYDENDVLIDEKYPERTFTPLFPGLFDEGYIGENIVILPD